MLLQGWTLVLAGLLQSTNTCSAPAESASYSSRDSKTLPDKDDVLTWSELGCAEEDPAQSLCYDERADKYYCCDPVSPATTLPTWYVELFLFLGCKPNYEVVCQVTLPGQPTVWECCPVA